jgi:hypothetical protein
VSFDTDLVAVGGHPSLMGVNFDEKPENRSVPSATSRDGRHRSAKGWLTLLTVVAAGVLAVSGVVVLPKSNASATASSGRPKTDVASGLTSPSGSEATRAASAPVRGTTDLFGDSIGYQAEPYLDILFAKAGYRLSNYTFGGTATCDWLGKMASAAADHPEAAVLVFSGNAFTPCMDAVAPRSTLFYYLYIAYTEQAIRIFSAAGTHVFLVGTPIDRLSVAGWDDLDHIYQELAWANPHDVTYVDAGAAVESPGGRFTWQLPCMRMEPSCGANGTNVVRAPDGVHFCPDGTPSTRGVTGPCDEYSPGAFRFALAIVKAVRP